MKSHPFAPGQKIVCLFSEMDDVESFSATLQMKSLYTVGKVHFGEDGPRVSLKEIRSRRYQDTGFAAWRFRLKGAELQAAGDSAAALFKDPALAAATAMDPAADPLLLALLFSGRDSSLHWSLAVNPNTPGFILHQLWETYPLAIPENPLLTYQSLRSGKPFHELVPVGPKMAFYAALVRAGRLEEMEGFLPAEDRCQWLSEISHPKHKYFLDALPLLVRDSSARVRAAMAENLPVAFLQPMIAEPLVEIRRILARRMGRDSFRFGWLEGEAGDPAVTDKVRVILCNTLASDPDKQVRLTLAGSTLLTGAAHRLLARDPEMEVRLTLAGTSQCRSVIGSGGWRSLADSGREICLVIAGNPSCSDLVKLDLTGHGDPAIRLKAWKNLDFGNGSLCADLLTRRLNSVFSDPAAQDTLVAIAENKTITEALASRLLPCSQAVRDALAGNTMMPPESKRFLLRHASDAMAAKVMEGIPGDYTSLVNEGGQHQSPLVRAVVAALPGRQAARLRPILAEDPDCSVRMSVLHYLMEWGGVSYDGSRIRKALEILSRDPEEKIRAAVVRDARLSEAAAEAMRSDRSVPVRLRLLEFRRRDDYTDFALMDNEAVSVRVEAAKLIMDAWPWRGQDGVAGKAGRVKGAQRLLLDLKITRDPSPLVRRVVAESLNASTARLGDLIADPDPGVQQALIDRPMDRSRKCAGDMIKFASGRNPYARAMVAAMRGAGKRRLLKLAADRCWYVRATAAKYVPLSEAGVLETLAQDRHPLVRECASRRIREGNQAAAEAKGGCQ